MESAENKGKVRKNSLGDLLDMINDGQTRQGDLSFLDLNIEKTVISKRNVKHLLIKYYSNIYWLEKGGPTASFGSFKSREEVVTHLKQEVGGMRSALNILGLADMATAVLVKVREDLRRERGAK